MTPKNLAVVFAPTIMRDHSLEREMTDMHAKNNTVQFVIENSHEIFGGSWTTGLWLTMVTANFDCFLRKTAGSVVRMHHGAVNTSPLSSMHHSWSSLIASFYQTSQTGCGILLYITCRSRLLLSLPMVSILDILLRQNSSSIGVCVWVVVTSDLLLLFMLVFPAGWGYLLIGGFRGVAGTERGGWDSSDILDVWKGLWGLGALFFRFSWGFLRFGVHVERGMGGIFGMNIFIVSKFFHGKQTCTRRVAFWPVLTRLIGWEGGSCDCGKDALSCGKGESNYYVEIRNDDIWPLSPFVGLGCCW